MRVHPEMVDFGSPRRIAGSSTGQIERSEIPSPGAIAFLHPPRRASESTTGIARYSEDLSAWRVAKKRETQSWANSSFSGIPDGHEFVFKLLAEQIGFNRGGLVPLLA